MQVNFFANLRYAIGNKTVEVPIDQGTSVRQLIRILVERYPALRSELLNDQGQLQPHINIMVNGRNTRFLENDLDTLLVADDRISIFPPVGGG